MAMASTLVKYLAQNGIAYDIVPHRYTLSSLHTAHAAKVSADKVAKPVIFEDETGYLMAVVPATQRVKIGELNHVLNRHMGLATEAELPPLFSDCDLGATPPIGQAYGMETVVDDSLTQCSDVYFEAGDHQELIHVKGSAFRKLMKNSQHATICVH